MADLVHTEKRNGYAVVILSNPPMNVLSERVFKELDEAFSRLGRNPEVTAVILTAAGDRAFVAGADIKGFPELIGKSGLKKRFMETHAVLNKIDSFEKPVIAALNGLTLGGGTELALCCDIRIAGADIQIGLPEITLGLFPGGGGTQRLPRLIGEAKAKELMFTGIPVDAAEAGKIGLVNRVVPTGDVLGAAEKMAARISSFSLPALSRIKQAVDEGLGSSLEEGIEREVALF